MKKLLFPVLLVIMLTAFISCSQSDLETTDSTLPVAGNSGTITTSSVASETLTLNWTAGSDDVSAQADLQYLSYYSTMNNIDTVTNCEANGTPVGSYSADITTKAITGLSASTTYYFNVIVKDNSGNMAVYTSTQATTATPDLTNPVPGNAGTITTSSVTSEALTLNWTASTDNFSAQADLQYLAYYSTSNNIDSVANCEANGTAVGSYLANISTKAITGLNASTTYYFNVIVKDTSGNKAVFTTVVQATTAAPDVTDPVPGNAGTITTASVTHNTLTLNWTAATDNVSAQATLQYLAYYSTSNNIDSVANCEANGTAVGAYAANIATKGVSSLTDSTTYYFN